MDFELLAARFNYLWFLSYMPYVAFAVYRVLRKRRPGKSGVAASRGINATVVLVTIVLGVMLTGMAIGEKWRIIYQTPLTEEQAEWAGGRDGANLVAAPFIGLFESLLFVIAISYCTRQREIIVGGEGEAEKRAKRRCRRESVTKGCRKRRGESGNE